MSSERYHAAGESDRAEYQQKEAAAPAAAAAVPLDQFLDELIDDLRTDGPATGGDHEGGEEMC